MEGFGLFFIFFNFFSLFSKFFKENTSKNNKEALLPDDL